MVAHNTWLDRQEAVKFWLKLRPADRRNKFEQGIREAQTVARIASGWIPVIYSAGAVGDRCFYACMEVVEGQTMDAYLKTEAAKRTFLRGFVAREYIKALIDTSVQGHLHGDAHAKNVMLNFHGRRAEPQLTLLDFGTSLFVRRRDFEKRHWYVVHQTLAHLLRTQAIGFDYPKPAKELDAAARLDHYWRLTKTLMQAYEKRED